MLAWPHEETDWAPILDDARACYVGIVGALTAVGCPVLIVTPHPDEVTDDLRAPGSDGDITIVRVDTNDTWTRDYGPLTIEGSDGTLTAADFCFNGWGMKFAANFDNRVNARLHSLAPATPYIDCLDTVLEGGSIETDGCGTVLTTAECLLSVNRNDFNNKSEAEEMLRDKLGARRVLWLDYGALEGDDTDSHIDTLARMAPDDTIIYVKSYRPDDSHTPGLERMEQQLRDMRTEGGEPYRLVPVPLPEPCYEPADGHRLPATYANFLITPKAVIMPLYGQPDNDERARTALETIFSPERRVIGVDCRALIRQHGSLHCATMQLPLAFVNEIKKSIAHER